ncbi:hypothetical protein ACFQ60_17675 [Streptomyces zhihengii]
MTRTVRVFVTVGAGSGAAVTVFVAAGSGAAAVAVAVTVAVTVGAGAAALLAALSVAAPPSDPDPATMPMKNTANAAGITTRFRAHFGRSGAGGTVGTPRARRAAEHPKAAAGTAGCTTYGPQRIVRRKPTVTDTPPDTDQFH